MKIEYTDALGLLLLLGYRYCWATATVAGLWPLASAAHLAERTDKLKT